MARSIADKALYRFGYAISMFVGAERILRDGLEPRAPYVMPAYLLIGFALENAFASYLIAKKHPRPGVYQSHRLASAMAACATHCLVFSNEATEFVKKLDPWHRDFVFRYPEKMENVTLNIKQGLVLTYSIIRDVEIGLKMAGINPTIAVEKPTF
jgi:hypothetical protein